MKAVIAIELPMTHDTFMIKNRKVIKNIQLLQEAQLDALSPLLGQLGHRAIISAICIYIYVLNCVKKIQKKK